MSNDPLALQAADSSVEAKKPKSGGEKLFDRVVYGGFAGLGTFVLTLFASFKLNHGSRAGKYYHHAVDWTERQLGRVFKSGISREAAEQGVMTTSLMMGGNAMLLPIGVAEHYKVPIVSGLNTMLGDKTPPEQVELSPKQTWMSLIEGRLLAWTAVFTVLFSASVAFQKTFTTFTREFAEHTHAAVHWLTRKPKTGAMEHSTSFRVGQLAALDVFATAAAATLLYVGGHFFARKQEEKKERKAERLANTGHPSRDGVAEILLHDPVVPKGTLIRGDRQHEGVVKDAAQQTAQLGQ